MDDLNERLAELLNDPESMKRVRDMAENLLGNQQKKQKEEPSNTADIGSIFDGDIDIASIGKITSVLSRLKNTSNDSRSNLLLALKPLLSAPRREKVDTAIKLLKLIDLLPLLRDNDVFQL